MLVECAFMVSLSVTAPVSDEELRRRTKSPFHKAYEFERTPDNAVAKALTPLLSAQNKWRNTEPAFLPWAATGDKAGEMLSDLKAQLTGDSSLHEDYMRPSTYSIGKITELLLGARALLKNPFPRGMIFADGDGGIRIEWNYPHRELRLAIPYRLEDTAYIYHENGDKYDADYNVSTANLAHWLNWITESTDDTKQ